ncbi:MAG: DUF1453 family protein [Sphingomonas sp.]|nr:DUF1453 family protein [Sphingomonas sp.]
MNWAGVLSIGIPLALVAALYVRTGREGPLRFDQLWLTPAVAVLSIATALALQPHAPFGALAWAALAIAALIGLTTGTLRARTVRMRFDPENGRVLTKTQSYAFALFAALFAFRLLTGPWLAADPAAQQRAIIGFDATLAFALAMIVAQRLGIFRRSTRLLAGARS